jgi:hypothetical protein
MNFEILRDANIDYLDNILIENGRLKLLSAGDYARIDRTHLRIWASRRGRYCLPTEELVDWLKVQTKGKTVIEIGSGNGDLSFHLGIVGFDNYCQAHNPEVVQYYKAIGQQPTQPPQDIHKLDAVEAVKIHKPQAVIGSWITHRFNGVDGNQFGPDEEEIIRNVEMYIHIGNERIHGMKPISRFPHKTFSFPWIVSRAANPAEDVIYVWEGFKK